MCEPLAEAQAQLGRRLVQLTGTEDQRRGLIAQIAEKERERKRILTLYRRNLIGLDDVDTHLADTAGEAGTLRALLASLEADEALASAQEAPLADATSMLLSLRDRLAEIEGTDNRAAKREIIERLMHRITVHSQGSGRRKQARVSLVYSFSPASPSFSSEIPTVSPRRSGADIPAPSSG